MKSESSKNGSSASSSESGAVQIRMQIRRAAEKLVKDTDDWIFEKELQREIRRFIMEHLICDYQMYLDLKAPLIKETDEKGMYFVQEFRITRNPRSPLQKLWWRIRKFVFMMAGREFRGY